MRVFVTGASGYVGTKIATTLQAHGHQITVLMRPQSTRTAPPNARVLEGDIGDEERVAGAMGDCEAVVHLVGIIREQRKQNVTMGRIHVQGTQSVLSAAKLAGVKKFVHMSALGARVNASSDYHKTKWQAEELVRTSGIPYTIFQPSVVFGRGGEGPNFLDMLKDLVNQAPMVPVIGNGNFRLQPVAIETLACAFTKAVHCGVGDNQTFQVGGPTIVTYREILEMICKRYDKPFRRVHIPLWMMNTVVPIFERFHKFPITSNQLTMLKEGNFCTNPSDFNTTFDCPVIKFTVD